MGFLTPTASGEHDVLTTYALQQLAQLRTTVHGLTDEQANTAPSASALTLTALLAHCADVAEMWSMIAAAAPGSPSVPDDLADRELDVRVAARPALADVLADFDRRVAEAETRLQGLRDLGAPAPAFDAPWIHEDVHHWEVRWCLTHLCTEVARHAGHADVIRESLDGMTSFALNRLVDGEDGVGEG